jgi:hypothetical protein
MPTLGQSTLVALAAIAVPAMASAQTPAPPTAPPAAAASTRSGDILFDSRLRYEGVSQDGLDDATALTLRARFGWQSPELRLPCPGRGRGGRRACR